MVVSAATYTVGASGANYTCIQDALDNSSDGDTIEVWNGTHVPPGPQNVYKVNNSVDIVGNSSESTIINLSVDAANGFYIYSDYVNISNINFTDANAGEGYASGVASEYNFTNISNCVFYSCANGVSLASDAFPATNAIVANNTFIGSLIDDYDNQNPISLVSVYYANITNNTIIGNFTPQTRDADAAIYIDGVSQNNIIKDNIIRNFTEAIHIDGETETAPADNTFTGNILIDNTLGINISTADADDNIFYDNYFSNTVDWSITPGFGNIWNTSKTSDTNVLGGSNIGGNFWSGYTNTTYDNDSDGIGDTPYTLFGAELDNLPLLFTGPQNITASVVNHDDINISWDMGFNCDNVIVVRKVGSYPTSRTDGTEVTNTTNTYHEEEIVFNTYYALWGYNAEVEDYTAIAYLTFYGLRLYAYNESNSTEGITFDVLLTNLTRTEVHEQTSCTNPTYLEMADIPTGDDINIKFSATGYADRTIIQDLDSSTWTTLIIYLAEDTNLYFFQIVESGFKEPIEDAKVTIQRYINATVGFETITTLYTDIQGLVDVYLIPDERYNLNLSKSGYYAKDEEFYPDPTYYGLSYIKQYSLSRKPEDPYEEVIFENICIFNASWDTSNNSIKIRFIDKESETTNATFNIYEMYNGTRIHNATVTYLNQNTITHYFEGGNTSRTHLILLNITHDTLGQIDEIPRIVLPLHDTIWDKDWIEDKIETALGEFELGWTNMGLLFGPTILLILGLSAVGQPGMGLIAGGGYLFLISQLLELPAALFENVAILISSLIILGFIALVIAWRPKQ